MNRPRSALRKPLIRLAVASSLLVLLAACGGGGPVQEPNTDATITVSVRPPPS